MGILIFSEHFFLSKHLWRVAAITRTEKELINRDKLALIKKHHIGTIVAMWEVLVIRYLLEYYFLEP